MLIFIFILTALSVPIAASEEFSGGSGSETDPYRIASADDLWEMARLVSAGHSTFASASYVLTSDITVYNTQNLSRWMYEAPGKSFTPIGNLDHPFTGHFNGGGHTIRGVFYFDDSAEYAGLFGVIGGGCVENLSVRDSYIRAHKYVGGIAGFVRSSVKNTAILRCKNAATVKGTSYTGGIAGYISAEGSSITVAECENDGEVIGYNGVGGISGSNHSKSTLIMENCVNTAQISGGNFNLGGITGENFAVDTAIVRTSYNKGLMYRGGDGYYHGSVVGLNRGESENSLALVADCYYLTDTDKTGVGHEGGYSTVSGVEERTRMMMGSKNAFPAFDFTSVWSMPKDGSPQLDRMEKMMAGEVTVTLMGNNLILSPSPIIRNDRTFLPMRSLYETLGAKISWDGEARTVSAVRDGSRQMFTVDSPRMTVNDTAILLDVAPFIEKDRTMIPLRAAAEGLGLTVSWEPYSRTVILNQF